VTQLHGSSAALQSILLLLLLLLLPKDLLRVSC
jgi:hypothetical protein